MTDDLRGPFQDYIFDVLGLNTILATVLVSNRAMTRYMLKSGWNLDKTLDRNIKSQTADALLDLSYLSLSRDAVAQGSRSECEAHQDHRHVEHGQVDALALAGALTLEQRGRRTRSAPVMPVA